MTKRLYEILYNSKAERYEVIEEVERLLHLRQGLLESIHPPFLQEEEQLGKQMLLWNEKIDDKMEQIQSSIKKDLNTLSNKKNKAQKYSNPYNNMQTDGYFYDKKK
ncbi:flagellar protein FliT [Bacillus sp. SCS-153A]|uniref:flagellar protein FliT n=1 Tax=Rossellomorea sedimentorum TaxID=3115294 RepID=UPI0039062064